LKAKKLKRETAVNIEVLLRHDPVALPKKSQPVKARCNDLHG
jgi:hypothetical protein